MLIAAIRRNLLGLARFSGRESLAGFWLYAGAVLVVTALVLMVATLPLVGVADPPRHGADAPASFFKAVVARTAAVAALAVALLAAAATRRLHDRDLRGWWGLLPLPFLAAGLALASEVFERFVNAPDGEMTPFFVLFLNNLLYLAALGLLAVRLAGPGSAGPNRFGPPTD